MNKRDIDFDPVSLITLSDAGGVFELLDSKDATILIGSSPDVRLSLLRIYGDESGQYKHIWAHNPTKVTTYTPFYKDDRVALANALRRAKSPLVPNYT